MAYRGPNVSQYIANLNAINPSFSSPEANFDELAPEDDLALFASTEFFDFDMAQPLPSTNNDTTGDVKDKKEVEEEEEEKTTKTEFNGSHVDLMEGLLEFNYETYASILPIFPEEQPFNPQLIQSDLISQTVPQPPPPPPPTTPLLSHQPQPTFIRPQPILPNVAAQSTPRPRPAPLQLDSPLLPIPSPASTPRSPTTSINGNKRKDPPTDSARVAADEDKRRRNTAASARFRVKKKQREQALEQHAKELEKLNTELNERVERLEMENTWLKALITDKKDTTTTTAATPAAAAAVSETKPSAKDA